MKNSIKIVCAFMLILMNVNVSFADNGLQISNVTQTATGMGILFVTIYFNEQSRPDRVSGILQSNESLTELQAKEMVGAKVKYEAILDGQKISVSQELTTLEDVAKFDSRRLEAFRLGRMSEVTAKTVRMKASGIAALGFGIVGGYLLFNSMISAKPVFGDFELSDVIVGE